MHNELTSGTLVYSIGRVTEAGEDDWGDDEIKDKLVGGR